MGKKSKKIKSPAAVAPLKPKSQEVVLGDRVSLKDLKSTSYNGKLGVIVSIPKKANDDRYGVLVDGADTPVAIRSQNITWRERSGRKSTLQLREERDWMISHIERPREESCTADQMAMMRMMMTMFMTEEQQVALYGRTIDPMPNFQNELMEEGGGLPVGVDYDWANSYLRLSFENASANPQMFEVVFKSESYKPEPRDIAKRLGSTHPAQLDWYLGGEVLPGCIFTKRFAQPYRDFFRHSFSNQAYRKEALLQGTTHVAVGFVDLGLLLASTLHNPPKGREGPLHFLGVEMSAYTVAKTHVIWEMLKQTHSSEAHHDDHIRSIMQVWFSSTWEEKTETAVNAALAVLTSSNRDYHCDVLELLNHWANAFPFPLAKARAFIANATKDSFSSIGHLLQKRDRIALAKYELSRDFGIKDRAAYGNKLMFDCPDGTPPLENDETVFSALNWYEVMDLVKSSSLSTQTLVQAAEAYASAGIRKIASWAAEEQVVVELKCSPVQDVVEFISSRKPWTMSWSNICDYVDYSDFHQMARRCSAHGDTIHFGYSMNWVQIVFGVFIFDFAGPDCVEIRSHIIDAANKAVQESYTLLGWDQHLRSPPPTNPINTTSHHCLEYLHFRKWCDYFFGIARRDGPCQVGNVEHAFSSPLSTTGASTVAFSWTYDADIHFNNIADLA